MSIDPKTLEKQVKKRRTFAIISHPDAGKTTLTEKLLLYGGAIHLAGAVKAKKNQRHTTSDWMELEKQRGISVSSTVLQFSYGDYEVNLLDTPGHKDFSEDTYRTLMAADAAVMLIDAGKGVEPQTRKLFEVCRMRGIPIFTFMNKMDRPAREPLDLIDELEKVLGIRSCPMTWPIGSGDRFRGVYELATKSVLGYASDERANVRSKLISVETKSFDDPNYKKILAGPKNDIDSANEIHDQLTTELELVEMAGDPFDQERVNKGQLTPVFFGSALNNFGVEHFLKRFLDVAPQPIPRETDQDDIVKPTDPNMSAFVFKIQANMDPNHRDRVAFLRICSGKFERNMSVHHSRISKPIKLSMPVRFFGQEREIVETAWPGDILGVMDTTGNLRIGDTLSEKKGLKYKGIPSFSPEHFASILIEDPMKRKQLQKGVQQLEEEGVVQVYRQKDLGDKDPILGGVGALQFDVFKHRIQMEYGVPIKVEPMGFVQARWLQGPDKGKFEERDYSRIMLYRDGNMVVLFKSEWAVRWATENYPGIEFSPTAPL